LVSFIRRITLPLGIAVRLIQLIVNGTLLVNKKPELTVARIQILNRPISVRTVGGCVQVVFRIAA